MAEYTEISLEEFETFLKRSFRALRFKRGEERGEAHYIARMDDGRSIMKVYSSISEHGNRGRDVGQDTIKVVLLYPGPKRKYTPVKRVKGWRSNLQDRIEEALEAYEDYRTSELASNAVGPQDAGDPQSPPVVEEKSHGLQDPPQPAPEPHTDSKEQRSPERPRITFTKWHGQDWAVRIVDPSPGEVQPGSHLMVTRANGNAVPITTGQLLTRGRDRDSGQAYEIWSIPRDAPRGGGGGGYRYNRYATDDDLYGP